LRRLMLFIQFPLALMVLYLDILSVAATLRRREPKLVSTRLRFAILVPAHDEEALLPRLLHSIAACDYPRERYNVYVVADNCSDSTAAIAKAAGVSVHERQDDRRVGKGHALHWLLSRIDESSAQYDAFVFLDADSVISTNFLQVINRHLAGGAQAVQSYYGVLNDHESWASALRYAGLALYNGLRPRGRDALGLSAGIHGNGMAFTQAVVDRFGWQAFTLAEDVEFHLKLVESGIRVRYAAEATVLAEMPTTLRQARSQNVRWERGRLQLLRTFGVRLLIQGVRQRNPVLLDAVGEQLVPPLSVLTGLTCITFLVATALRVRDARRLATVLLLGQTVYVVTGLRLVKASAGTYLALLGAPFYIIWKLVVYGGAAAHIGENRWIRTARSR
jgi:1,2-diacylglycerol 3-beta-glucosyltransferase